jgi:tripartite-type tricarboxylate transporter receptor subunit TctC
MRIRTTHAVCCTLAALLLPSAANAQNYPSRQVRIVVGFGAGGPDTTARILAQQFTQQTGQAFIVDNRPGAGGTIGAGIVAAAAPDGNTLLVSSASFAVNPSIYKTLPFDAIKDFTPISQICDADGHILTVISSLPVQNVKNLIAMARKPGSKLSYGSNGVGATGHLVGALFNSRIGGNMVHVPYKGAGATLTGLLSGEVQLGFINAALGLPLIKAGKLRAIAYDSPQRAPYLPDVPTMAEAGAPPTGMKTSWHGLFGPAKLPPAVVARLEAEVKRALSIPDVRDRFDKLELNPIGSTSAEFKPVLATSIKRFGEMVRLADVQPE